MRSINDITESPAFTRMPIVLSNNEDVNEEEGEDDDRSDSDVDEEKDSAEQTEQHEIQEEQWESPEQLEQGLITLSLEPRSKWQSLLQLETIKVRQ